MRTDAWKSYCVVGGKKLQQIVHNLEGIEKSPLPNKSGGDVLDYKQARHRPETSYSSTNAPSVFLP